MENINNVQGHLLNHYSRSNNRILFIDYDGTLVPFKPHPHEAAPPANVKEVLSELVKDPSNLVVLISGREKETLEKWFGDLPLTLVAEHGGFYKELNQPWQSYFSNSTAWKDKILHSLRGLAFQYEGSFIEEKHFSVAWHYRVIADKINEADKKQILSAIHALPFKNEFLVYDEDCTLEFRTAGIDKGKFAGLYIWSKERFDFILAIGDGKTDEDLFQTLEKKDYTIKVGKSPTSFANYFIDKQEYVLSFLAKISSVKINS